MSEWGFGRAALLTIALFAAALIAGIVAVMSDPSVGQTFIDLFKQSVVGELSGDSALLLFVKIFLNNLQACVLLFIGGATFGVLTLFILSVNGVVIGAITEFAGQKQGLLFVAAAILPHGIFEIPSFIISGALGFLLAKSLIDEWYGTADASLSAAHQATLFVKFVIPLVLVAAFVEAFITPEIIRLVS